MTDKRAVARMLAILLLLAFLLTVLGDEISSATIEPKSNKTKHLTAF